VRCRFNLASFWLLTGAALVVKLLESCVGVGMKGQSRGQVVCNEGGWDRYNHLNKYG